MTYDEIQQAVADETARLGALLKEAAELRRRATEWLAIPYEQRSSNDVDHDGVNGRGTHDLDRYYIPRIANAIAALSGGGK